MGIQISSFIRNNERQKLYFRKVCLFYPFPGRKDSAFGYVSDNFSPINKPFSPFIYQAGQNEIRFEETLIFKVNSKL
jgi:hypothetical protein